MELGTAGVYPDPVPRCQTPQSTSSARHRPGSAPAESAKRTSEQLIGILRIPSETSQPEEPRAPYGRRGSARAHVVNVPTLINWSTTRVAVLGGEAGSQKFQTKGRISVISWSVLVNHQHPKWWEIPELAGEHHQPADIHAQTGDEDRLSGYGTQILQAPSGRFPMPSPASRRGWATARLTPIIMAKGCPCSRQCRRTA